MKQKPLLVLEGRWSVTHRVLGARRPPLQEKMLPSNLLPKVLARLCSLPPLCSALSNWEGKLFPTLQYTGRPPASQYTYAVFYKQLY